MVTFWHCYHCEQAARDDDGLSRCGWGISLCECTFLARKILRNVPGVAVMAAEACTFARGASIFEKMHGKGALCAEVQASAATTPTPQESHCVICLEDLV